MAGGRHGAVRRRRRGRFVHRWHIGWAYRGGDRIIEGRLGRGRRDRCDCCRGCGCDGRLVVEHGSGLCRHSVGEILDDVGFGRLVVGSSLGGSGRRGGVHVAGAWITSVRLGPARRMGRRRGGDGVARRGDHRRGDRLAFLSARLRVAAPDRLALPASAARARRRPQCRSDHARGDDHDEDPERRLPIGSDLGKDRGDRDGPRHTRSFRGGW